MEEVQSILNFNGYSSVIVYRKRKSKWNTTGGLEDIITLKEP
jgi:hypothetical protein